MRTTFDAASVRLYHLDSEVDGGATTTLFYKSLSEALAIAGNHPDEVRAGLFIATDNDLISYLDLLEG